MNRSFRPLVILSFCFLASCSTAQVSADHEITVLHGADQLAAVQKIRTCLPDQKAFKSMSVHLILGLSPEGLTELAMVAPQDQTRLESDQTFRSFAMTAVRAALDPACAAISLPSNAQEGANRLGILFSP